MCKLKGKGSLGFRDLRTFNMVLLGKQFWKILTNDSTLLHQVYKAKYFLNTSFMETKLGPNPSYTWRGIFKA